MTPPIPGARATHQFPASESPPQTKLVVNAPGDVYEQQADRVADQVVEHLEQPAADVSALNAPLSRAAVSVMRIATSAAAGAGSTHPTTAPAEVATTLASTPTSYQTIASDVRTPLEQAFGHDFAQVRIHTGARADKLSRSLNARAFTHGKDIYFRAGAYQPAHRPGMNVLAHELTHVVQQTGAARGPGIASGTPRIQRKVFANNWDKVPKPLTGPEIRASLQSGMTKAQYTAMVAEVTKAPQFFYPDEPEKALVAAFDFIAADSAATYTLSLPTDAQRIITDAKKYALSGVPKAETTKANSGSTAMSFDAVDAYLTGKGFVSNTNTWMLKNSATVTLGNQIYTLHATINKASFPASLKNGLPELRGFALNDYHISLEGDTPTDNVRFYFDSSGTYLNKYSIGNSGKQNGVPPGATASVMTKIKNLGSSFQQFLIKLA